MLPGYIFLTFYFLCLNSTSRKWLASWSHIFDLRFVCCDSTRERGSIPGDRCPTFDKCVIKTRMDFLHDHISLSFYSYDVIRSIRHRFLTFDRFVVKRRKNFLPVNRFQTPKECVDWIISERGLISMDTDFKLRRNVLIGLYMREDVLTWRQISNSEGMCCLDYIWERTYFHGDRFLTFDLCVGFNWRENFLPGHRILTFNLCVGFNWRENFLHDLRILTFDLFVGFNWRENFLADQISNFRFLCRDSDRERALSDFGRQNEIPSLEEKDFWPGTSSLIKDS